MDRQRKLAAVRQVLGDPRVVSGDEHAFICPRQDCPSRRTGRPKLVVNIATDKFRCWNCRFRGPDLSGILRIMRNNPLLVEYLQEGGAPDPSALTPRALAVPEIPSGFRPVGDHGGRYMDYLRARGVTIEQAVRYRLGYCTYGRWSGRIVMPSFDQNGSVNFVTGRAIEPRFWEDRYWNPPYSKDVVVYGGMVDWSRPVVLVEGMFDAIATGEDAIPICGTHVRPKLLECLVRNQNPVYLALDSDACEVSYEIAANLLSFDMDVRYCRLPGKDPAEIGRVAMRDVIRQGIHIRDELGLLRIRIGV